MAMGGKSERGYRIGVEEASSGFIIPEFAPALQASQAIGDPSDQVAYVIAAPLSHGSNPNSNMAGRRREDDENLVAYALRSDPGGIGQGHNTNFVPISFDAEFSNQGEPSEHAILTRKLRRAVATSGAVRRLTPTECERLQALPDGWTAHGPDSRRYAALGDAVTASVAEWIGRRILARSAA